MAKLSKKYKVADAAVDRAKRYPLAEAISFAKTHATKKFDETIDIVLKLGIDAEQSDQTVRGMVNLPHGTGKKVRVAVFARGDKAADAQKAGADLVGAEDLAEKIEKGELNFDRCIASPDMMGVVGKVAKILGPKGLMPNPKLGTVTPNIADAVKAAKSGQVEFRADKSGLVHAGIGKASFEEKAIVANIKAFIEAVNKAKPASVKGVFIEKAAISSTMGVGLKLDVTSLAA